VGTREAKGQVVAEVKDRLERARAAILTDYRGLDVTGITELRERLREAGAEYRVVKNTLTARAAEALGLEEVIEFLEGPTAIAFAYDDPVVPAKVINQFARTHKELEIKAGLLGKAVIDAGRVRQLAELPSRDELLGQFVGTVAAPLTGLVTVLAGPMRGLVTALDQLRSQREETA